MIISSAALRYSIAIALLGVTPATWGAGFAEAVASHEKTERRATVSVSGIVREAATNTPLEAANVFVQGHAAATATDASGRYALTIRNVALGTSVQVSVRRLGYKPRTISLELGKSSVTLDAVLETAPAMLDAVAVTGVVSEQHVAKAFFTVATVAAVEMPRGRSPALPANSPPARSEADLKRRVAESISLKRLHVAGGGGMNREQYDRIEDNPFLAVNGNALSTFSIDVDRASYGNMRRFLNDGQRPPADAIRIEELVNYFSYSLEEPRGKDPIAITTEVAPAPWQSKHQLVRIALQARHINTEDLPPNNLVFLIDVSGSMSTPDKLPLVKQSLRMLVDQLREQDRVALVVYAGNAGLVLPSTSGAHKTAIQQAIDRLEAGGSTAGGAGLMLAYKTARENFMESGNNRVILATDGDFNVGASSDAEMERLVEEKRAEGTYLTVLGFGRGNIQDAKMEKLAKKGNGNYAYVDNLNEARKTLVKEMGATLVTVANDVKLQIEFNPSTVQAYRLIGYEDRLLRNEDFADDRKDAGDIGSGHTVTALYEIVPVGVVGTVQIRGEDSLRYVHNAKRSTARAGSEMLFVKLRYKVPGESKSHLMTQPVRLTLADRRTSDDFRFAASVASFGMLLRGSEHKGSSNGSAVLEMARGALGEDPGEYRAEFVRLVERWESMRIADLRE